MQFDEIPKFERSDLESVRNVIDHGGIGVVGLWKWKINRKRDGIRKGGYAAVKNLGQFGATERDVSLTREANILWGLHDECRHIVRLFGLVVLQNKLSLVLEYVVHQSVSNFFQIISKEANRAADEDFWPLKIRIADQVCEGMAFLHGKEKPILHRDLKAANVLLDDRLNVKICDFGLATFKRMTKIVSNPEFSRARSNKQITGTISHIPPEFLNRQEIWTKKCDVYSYGIFLWELITGKVPYGFDVPDQVIAVRVQGGNRPQTESLNEAPPELLQIMKTSWNQEPERRQHFKDLIPYFSNLYNAWMTEKSVGQALDVWKNTQETTPMKAGAVAGSLNDLDTSRRDLTVTKKPNVEAPEVSHFSFPEAHVSHDLDHMQRLQKKPSLSGQNQIVSNEVCISDFNNADNKENRPLLSEASPSPTSTTITSQPPKPASKKLCIITAIIATLAILAAGIFAVIYFIDRSPGCCLNCFNISDPGLTSKCDSTRGKSLTGLDPVPTGSVCTFNCKEGYVVNKLESNLTCEKDGKWSGAFPYCRKVRQCSALPTPANKGTFQCTNENYEASRCQFSCPEGSVLKLPGKSEKPDDPYAITCISDQFANYLWSGVVPYCEKVTACGPLNVSDVITDCSSPGMPAGDSYSNGTTCKFSCQNGQSLSEPVHTATCGTDGRWNVTHLKCLDACPNFTTPANGRLVKCTLGRAYNSRCNFTCNYNFTMLGAVNMVCRESGKWSNSPPKCVCPVCRSGPTCTNTRMFSDVVNNLTYTMYNHTPVNYDGHNISCSILKSVSLSEKTMKKLGSKNSPIYSCQCRDKEHNINKQCNGILSILDSCKHALSSLILLLSDKDLYNLPCDAFNMPPPCT